MVFVKYFKDWNDFFFVVVFEFDCWFDVLVEMVVWIGVSYGQLIGVGGV